MIKIKNAQKIRADRESRKRAIGLCSRRGKFLRALIKLTTLNYFAECIFLIFWRAILMEF